MDSREDLAVFNRRLASAYTAIELAKRNTELAGDAVESARDAAGKIAPESISAFDAVSDNIGSAARRLAAAIDALPPLPDESAD
jgi:hypothetical protein